MELFANMADSLFLRVLGLHHPEELFFELVELFSGADLVVDVLGLVGLAVLVVDGWEDLVH